MNKSFKEMSYTELLAERERIIGIINKTKSRFAKKDFNKCLIKISKEIKDYEKYMSI